MLLWINFNSVLSAYDPWKKNCHHSSFYWMSGFLQDCQTFLTKYFIVIPFVFITDHKGRWCFSEACNSHSVHRWGLCSGGERVSVRGGAWMETPPAATAAVGTHPTGMHSCFKSIHISDKKIIMFVGPPLIIYHPQIDRLSEIGCIHLFKNFRRKESRIKSIRQLVISCQVPANPQSPFLNHCGISPHKRIQEKVEESKLSTRNKAWLLLIV